MAEIILLRQWQLWHQEEVKRMEELRKALIDIYVITSKVPMDSLNGKLIRLDAIHEIAHKTLRTDEKLSCFDEKYIQGALMLKKVYSNPVHGPWLYTDCMRTTREVCEMWEATQI
jgi:hypothetical protein